MTEHDMTDDAPPRARRRRRRWLAGVLAGGLAVGLLAPAALAQSFPDVPPGRFYSAAVEWAFSNGITTGWGDTGEFRPDEPVTRGQMVTFLHRLEQHLASTLEGQRGPRGPAGPPGAPATSLWAVVDADGTLVRGSGVTSVDDEPGAQGPHTVRFDRPVGDCAYLATLGLPGFDGGPTTPPAGQVDVARATPFQNGVRVSTRDSSGAPVALPFHLAVLC